MAGAYFATASFCSPGALFIGKRTKPKAKNSTIKHVPAWALVGCVDATSAWSSFSWSRRDLKQFMFTLEHVNTPSIIPYFLTTIWYKFFMFTIVHVTTPTIIAYFLPNTVQVSPIVTPYRMSPLHQRVYQALPQTEWSVTHLFCSSKLLTFIDKLWLSSVQAFTLSSSPSM